MLVMMKTEFSSCRDGKGETVLHVTFKGAR